MSDSSLVFVLCASTASAFIFMFFLLSLAIRQTKNLQLLERHVDSLKQELKAVNKGAIGVGKKLIVLEKRLKVAVEHQQDLENSDPMKLSYNQAAKLVEMGASVSEVADSCGIPTAEVELINLLNNRRPSGDSNVARFQ